MIFLKNLFKGVGLATLSLNRCNMAQGLLRRSCFKYLDIIKKLPLPPTPTFKNLKFFFVWRYIYKKKLPYLILRSGKFGNLVTSFFSLFFQFILIFRKIRSVSRKEDHMILKFNLSFLRKNKNFEIGTCSFRAINYWKLLFKHQINKQVT